MVAGLTAFAWAPELRIPPPPAVDWPVWAARLEAKRASGSREPLVIPACPPDYAIVVDGPGEAD